MIFNFKKAKEENTLSAVPANRYIVKMTQVEQRKSKNTDTPMLSIEFTILTGEYKNRKLWHRISLNTDKSAIFLLNLLTAVNSPLVESDNVTIEQICNELKDKVCSVYADVKLFEGKQINETKSICALSDEEKFILNQTNPSSAPIPETKKKSILN